MRFMPSNAWNVVLYLLAEGRWWWSSSLLRWCWESEGILAGELRVSQPLPERLLSEPWKHSSPPLQQWSENIGRRSVSSDVSFLGLNTWKGNWIQSSIPLITLALASRLASASAAMARCSWWGNFTSLISTRSTLIPHGWVASSRASCRVTSNIKHSSHSYSLINNKSNTLYSTVRKPVASTCSSILLVAKKKSVLWMAGGNEGALKVSVIRLFLPFLKGMLIYKCKWKFL